MAFSMAWPEDTVQGAQDEERARGLLAAFRVEVYRCLGKRRDCLFELADAVLCRQARVHMLAELSLEPECRRGHGAVYDAVNAGRSRSPGCAGRWRACRCRPGKTGGSG